MRALSVRQPWAWQIINQRKDVENRTRNFVGGYRGPVAIHASLKPDRVALARLPMHPPEWVTARRVFDYGVILGVVDLVDVHGASQTVRVDEGGCCEPWGEHNLDGGVFHLVLANPRPIPLHLQPRCRGALGLWTPPADVVALLAAFI